MSKLMLIDATHPEEARVAVVDGKKLEEFDVEIASRRPLKGNIYLAKVTRVEPSLQAAFVEYGGNRHGFLAFSEIHPDYYRIPVGDREALLTAADDFAAEDAETENAENEPAEDRTEDAGALSEDISPGLEEPGADSEAALNVRRDALYGAAAELPHESHTETRFINEAAEAEAPHAITTFSADYEHDGDSDGDAQPSTEGEILEVPTVGQTVDTIGTAFPDDPETAAENERQRRLRNLRKYKIQEVIKRRQILLIQVTKEERGNKGAALTTYLSLAGRYCVLMPNTDRGGGISRRITSLTDRKRLKSIIDDLETPEGMAVIVRTAGSERSKAEVKRDFEYLLRLWDEIRETTLRSTAPALIYEEASLIKRSIRDLYTRDIGDIIVAGAAAYHAAKSFMRMLMPSHARRVQFYRDATVPLFQKYQIESQLAAIHNPVVQLRSGGYIVINQTEALVAIDVNSGRSTRERNIEETALRTNLEAAEEVARQLRLRDLAGLIVVDFIDMEENRNNAAVERRFKESLKNDRARIQIGRISTFGLLEMSRQRLHPSLQEASTVICAHCAGTGRMRSVDSTALHVLRMVEEEITRSFSPGITVFVPSAVALYILNHKRQSLAEFEMRRGIRIYLNGDDSLMSPDYRIERIKQLAPGEELPPHQAPEAAPIDLGEDIDAGMAEDDIEQDEETAAEEMALRAEADTGTLGEKTGERDHEGRRRQRRRRRRSGSERGERPDQAGGHAAPENDTDDLRAFPMDPAQESDAAETSGEAYEEDTAEAASSTLQDQAEGDQRRKRRRGRRGGRRRRGRHHDDLQNGTDESIGSQPSDQAVLQPAASSGHPNVGASDQPDLPQNGDGLPPSWRTGGAAAAAPARAYNRRGRKPQSEAGATPDAKGAVSQPRTEAPRPALAEAPTHAETTVAAEAGDMAPKRGWWRRLVE